VPRVVHHVEHDAGDLEVLQQRAAIRTIPAAFGRERRRIAQHPERLYVGRDRPEAFPVGRVRGRLVPPHRRLGAMDLEERMRKPVGEVVEIGEIDLGQPGSTHGGSGG
jgi:hypothetical protein